MAFSGNARPSHGWVSLGRVVSISSVKFNNEIVDDRSCSSPELAALIERQPLTDGEDSTKLYRDLPGIAATTNPNDKEGVGGLDVRIDLS